MEKLILSQNKLNEIEKQTGKASYNTLVHYYGNVILCNNIMQLDQSLFNNIEIGNITDDTESCFSGFEFGYSNGYSISIQIMEMECK